jgi:glycosyltransferase involved in cell wall biosynthesis
MLAKAERLIAVARFETELWGKRLQLPADRFVFIPNGADLPRPLHTPSTDRSLIVSVGRLERYKGHHRIITALPYILQQRPDVHLWIAGTGPYEAKLKQLAVQLHVADHVEIRAVPATERSRMAEELSRAALVMLLSDYETHPIAMLEAIALGRPVLVTDTSGLSELAYQGLATAIPLNSTPQHIASAVLDQLRAPHLPPPITLPSWDDCAAGLMQVYRQVTEGVRCAS